MPETEPVIPARNIVDSYFINATTDPTLAYTGGAVLLVGLALVGGGVVLGISEAPKLFQVLTQHHFAESIRSGLTILADGVVAYAGSKILQSAAYVSNHPNHQALFDYRAQARTRWNQMSNLYNN